MTRAVRFFTAPRTRAKAITVKASVPAARNTKSAINRLLWSRNVSAKIWVALIVRLRKHRPFPRTRESRATDTGACVPASPLARGRADDDAAAFDPSSLDPEIHQTPHDQVAHPHPDAGEHQRDLGHVLVPDAAVEVRHQQVDGGEQGDRQRGEDERGGAA